MDVERERQRGLAPAATSGAHHRRVRAGLAAGPAVAPSWLADRYDALAAATHEVVWLVTADGMFTGELPEWCAFTGQRPPDAQGWGWLRALPPDDQASAARAWRHALAESVPFEYEGRIARADGSVRYAALRVVPIFEGDGSVREWVGCGSDVTERRQHEEALRTHAALEALITIAQTLATPAAIPPAVAPARVVTRQTRRGARQLVDFACGVYGCARAAMVVIVPETEALIPIAIAGLGFRQARAWVPTVRRTRLSGSLTAIQRHRLERGQTLDLDLTQAWTPAPMRAPTPAAKRPPAGYVAGLVVPLRVGPRLLGLLLFGGARPWDGPPTERLGVVAAVARLATLIVERDTLQRERAVAVARAHALAEANQRMDVFLGIASHELKSPLTSVKLSIQMLLRRLGLAASDDAPQMGQTAQTIDVLRRADRQTARLTRLVNDILDASRIQIDKLDLNVERCDIVRIVADVVADVAAEQQQAAPSRHIALRLPRRGPVYVTGDADRLGQVVTNYLENALKYSPETAPIRVSLRVGGGVARVAVRDEGPGLPPAERTRVWERFQRARGMREHGDYGGGLGLGLYISKTIVERHGGQCGVRSTVGRGSTFWFTLPLRDQGQEDLTP